MMPKLSRTPTLWIVLTLFISLLLLPPNNAYAGPAITPSCTAPETLEPGLIRTTYDKTGYGHPNNALDYQDDLVDVYAIPANIFGSGIASQVNGSGNPFGSNDNYLTIFSGFIEVPTTDDYEFAVDGDDAIEVIIDGTVITGWYGGHGKNNSPNFPQTVNLDAGFHTIEFRHEEVGGGDNYYLYWRPPGAGAFVIMPGANFSSCQSPPVYEPAITPACLTPDPGLQLSTFDKTGYGHPSDHNTYNTLVSTYAIPSNLFGSGTVTNVNGSGNPFGTNENYLSIFTGHVFAPTTGIYFFGVDGDDAVEVLINGNSISGFYGGHASAGSAQNLNSIALNSGYHNLEFRHEETGGGDNYFLYWQKPGDPAPIITPGASLSHCPVTTEISVSKTHEVISDPTNLMINPKAVPGAIVRYSVTAEVLGANTADNVVIGDDLYNLITVLQDASWVSDSVTVTSPTINSGLVKPLTDIIDADEGEFNDVSGIGNRNLSVNCGSLATGELCIVTYDIELN